MYDRQKIEDEAYFQDWKEWQNLAGPYRPPTLLPKMYFTLEPPKPRPMRWAEYYCVLTTDCPFARNEPGFEIKAPSSVPILNLVRRLPDAHQHPLADYNSRNGDYRYLRCVFFVPANHWRAVKSSLPQIKTMTIEYLCRRS